MMQKKVCMVGLFATGKTSMVQRFVHSRFSDRYLSTVGVKIDRKEVEVDGAAVTFMLWDLAGRDGFEDITPSYLRGSHGILYVADGTRPETWDSAGGAERTRAGRRGRGPVGAGGQQVRPPRPVDRSAPRTRRPLPPSGTSSGPAPRPARGSRRHSAGWGGVPWRDGRPADDRRGDRQRSG